MGPRKIRRADWLSDLEQVALPRELQLHYLKNEGRNMGCFKQWRDVIRQAMHLPATRAVSAKHFELYSALNQPPFKIYLNSYVETTHSFGQSESLLILPMRLGIANPSLILKAPSSVESPGVRLETKLLSKVLTAVSCSSTCFLITTSSHRFLSIYLALELY